MNIKLSISLLASDRMDTLGRCLASLTPLLREVDSELIVVVTGKEPRVQELAEQYASKVVPFTWCNDFSKARNAGLSHAKGEWFLYLDDDEWFEDAGEIIRFFQTGEYKNYQSAQYVVRNYQDWGGKTYTDANVGRMCALTPETRFVFPIHENLEPFVKPCKMFTSFVHHFGYLRKQGEKDVKTERNLSLLLKHLEEEPDSVPCYMQLVQEYRGDKEYEKAIEYCEKGLEIAKKNQTVYSTELWMMCNLPVLISNTGETRRALEEGERILASPRIREVHHAYLTATVVTLCHQLREFKKGLGYVRRFNDELLFLRKHRDQAMLQSSADINLDAVIEKEMPTYLIGLIFAAELGDQTMLGRILTWMPWRDSGRVAQYYSDLELWKMKYKELKEKILECYSRLKVSDPYVNLQKAFYMEKKERTVDVERYWKVCADKCPSEFLWQVVWMAVKNGFPLETLLGQISLEGWESCVDMLAQRVPGEEQEAFCQKIAPALERYPAYACRLRQHFLEKKLAQGMAEYTQLVEDLRRYCESVIEEGRILYREEMISNSDFYALPSRLRFALKVSEVFQMIESGELVGCSSLLAEALELYPQMTAALSNLIRYLKEQIENPPKVVSEEFVQLGGQVKQAVLGLMDNGQWQEAYGVVGRFVTILPDDLEILRMKQKILREEV
ncbi:MAG: glycosyltransferase [Coprococcus sp.]|nr:glycosyltransferase [Coprococcus sp.]